MQIDPWRRPDPQIRIVHGATMGRQSPPGRSVGPRPHACTRTRACTAPTNACRLIISTSRVSIWAYIYARVIADASRGQPRSSSVRGDDISLSAAASVRLVAYCLRGHALDSFLPREDTQQIMSSSPELHVAIIVTTPLLRFTPRPPRPSFSREEVDGYVRESVCPARARKQRASQGSGWRLSAGRLAR